LTGRGGDPFERRRRTDEQDGGKYRLRKRPDGALFGYAVGPHSWKKFLFPPVTRL
jgi:sulfhydrogenase subunit beta (sulfur reductase)